MCGPFAATALVQSCMRPQGRPAPKAVRQQLHVCVGRQVRCRCWLTRNEGKGRAAFKGLHSLVAAWAKLLKPCEFLMTLRLIQTIQRVPPALGQVLAQADWPALGDCRARVLRNCSVAQRAGLPKGGKLACSCLRSCLQLLSSGESDGIWGSHC